MIASRFSNPRRVILLVGDVLTFLGFAAIGRMAHSMGTALDDVIGTAVPFLISWLLVAPFTRAYGVEATESVSAAAKRSLLTWVFAFPLGLLIRIGILRTIPHYSFAIVAGAFTAVTLTAWRSLLAKFTS